MLEKQDLAQRGEGHGGESGGSGGGEGGSDGGVEGSGEGGGYGGGGGHAVASPGRNSAEDLTCPPPTKYAEI